MLQNRQITGSLQMNQLQVMDSKTSPALFLIRVCSGLLPRWLWSLRRTRHVPDPRGYQGEPPCNVISGVWYDTDGSQNEAPKLLTVSSMVITMIYKLLKLRTSLVF